MKIRNAAIAAMCGILGAMSIGPNRLMAQASAGPIAPPAQSQAPSSQPKPRPKEPEIQPRTTLEGAWKLNHDESDDPRRKTQDSRGTNGGNGGGYPGGGYPGGGGGRYPGGGYPGGGYPGGGHPGGGYPGGGGPRGGQEDGGMNTDSEQRIQELIRPVSSLIFVLKTAEVDVTDEQFHRLIFFTDGRQLQKSTSDNYKEIAAHWNGSQLVSDEKTPQGWKMSRTFELSGGGRQVDETVSIDRPKSKNPLIVRYVYDLADSKNAQTGRDADPDRPVLKRHPDGGDSSTQ